MSHRAAERAVLWAALQYVQAVLAFEAGDGSLSTIGAADAALVAASEVYYDSVYSR